MARLTYLFDTNIIAEMFDTQSTMTKRIKQTRLDGHIIGLCQPAHYEILRGLYHVQATRKLSWYQDELAPLFAWIPLTDADWTQAAEYWAEVRRKGRQLSDVDLLLAAMSTRLDATLISADDDFTALPIRLENWRDATLSQDA